MVNFNIHLSLSNKKIYLQKIQILKLLKIQLHKTKQALRITETPIYNWSYEMNQANTIQRGLMQTIILPFNWISHAGKLILWCVSATWQLISPVSSPW